jgi:hypothetical protein
VPKRADPITKVGKHDQMARDKSQTRPCCTVSHRLEHQTAIGSHLTLSRPGWDDVVFAFHDNDKISPADAGAHRKGDWFKRRRLIGNPCILLRTDIPLRLFVQKSMI